MSCALPAFAPMVIVGSVLAAVLLSMLLLAAAATLLAVGWPGLRRRLALWQGARHERDAEALLRIADGLRAHAGALADSGLAAESERWAHACRRAAHDRLALINDLLVASMRGRGGDS